MKKILFVVVCVLMIFSICYAVEFTDFDLNSQFIGDDYRTAMDKLVEKGVINGYPDGTFKPTKTISRAEATKILVTAFDISLDVKDTKKFSDVEVGSWYEKYVYAMVSNGAIVGYEDGTYKPDKEVTIEEYITMLVKLTKLEVEEARKGDHWSTPYWRAADKEGFFIGYLTDDLIGMNALARENAVILTYNAMTYKPEEVKTGFVEAISTSTTAPTSSKELYFGRVKPGTYLQNGETVFEVDTFDGKVLKMKVLKDGTKPEDNSLIFFTKKQNGDITLKSEYPKSFDIDVGIEEINGDIIVLDYAYEELDMKKGTFKINGEKIDIDDYTFFFVTEDLDIDDMKYYYDSCEKVDIYTYKLTTKHELHFDTHKGIAVITKN